MASRKRKEGESFENYRKNLKSLKLVEKFYRRGKVWWQSHVRGTYKKE